MLSPPCSGLAWAPQQGQAPRPRRREPRSALLVSQGLAVFRRDGDIYVGVDYGQSGGGHGHPDRLNLTLGQDDTVAAMWVLRHAPILRDRLGERCAGRTILAAVSG